MAIDFAVEASRVWNKMENMTNVNQLMAVYYDGGFIRMTKAHTDVCREFIHSHIDNLCGIYSPIGCTEGQLIEDIQATIEHCATIAPKKRGPKTAS